MPVKKKIQKRPSGSAGDAKSQLYCKGKVDREVVRAATKMTRETWSKLQEGMDEKWPLPEYLGGIKGTTRFRDETYAIVTRWTAETEIVYRPHAKAPGSKSHLRYERYSKARTVGEALRLGSYPLDWCWDFERGFLRVTGGQVRDEPLNIGKDADESQLTEVDRIINHWYVHELAKMLGVKSKELAAGVGSLETTLTRAQRLLAQREATQRLEAADREGRMISDEDVLLTLQRWPFYQNPWRKNVMQPGKTWVFSDTLGLLRDRQGDLHLTAATRRYPQVAELFARWLMDRLPEETKGFSFTSMNVNCNYAAALHRDNGNFGPSFIKAFGAYSGGGLNYWPEDAGGHLKDVPKSEKVSFDLKKGLALFNGNCAHSVDAFSGSRYSIVYFTVGCHALAKPEDRSKLEQLGIPFPAPKADPYKLLRPPRGYGEAPARAKAKQGELPAFRFYGQAELQRQARRLKPKTAAEVKRIAARRVQPENAKSFYGSAARRERREEDLEMEY